MNIFNRLLVSASLLSILFLALGALGIATGLLTMQTVDSVLSYSPLHTALSDFHTSHPEETLVRKILVAAGTTLLAFLLLLSEVRPSRRDRTLRLFDSRDGEVTVANRALRRAAELASTGIAGVQHARCEIHLQQNSVRVRCRVAIDRHASAVEIGSHIESAIKQQLQQTLGRPVERVRVDIEPQQSDTPGYVR